MAHNCEFNRGVRVTCSSLERKLRGSNHSPVKSDTVLPTAYHRCDIFSKRAVLPGRNDAEMGPANSLHDSTYHSEYNKRFHLIDFLPIVPLVFWFHIYCDSFYYFYNQITILTTLKRKNVMANGTFSGVGVKPQVFSGPSHQIER